MQVSTQFIGLKDVQGLLAAHPAQAISLLQGVVSKRAGQAKNSFIEAMDLAYTSGFATGRLGNSITYRTLKRQDGVELRFYIRPYRELEFVTALLGGHFKIFPVRPFEIYPQGRKRLAIRRDAGESRVTLRLLRPGEPVLWGSQTGGFSRDVLSEVAEEEGRFFLEDVQNAMAEALSHLQNTVSGGTIR